METAPQNMPIVDYQKGFLASLTTDGLKTCGCSFCILMAEEAYRVFAMAEQSLLNTALTARQISLGCVSRPIGE
jgi:hypothetical protein